jgi:hypothetical protein
VSDIRIMVNGTELREVEMARDWIERRRRDAKRSSHSNAPASTNPFDKAPSPDLETYTVLLIPGLSPLALSVLKPLSPAPAILPLPLDLVPFDADLLSLSSPSFLSTTSLHGSTATPLTDVADSVLSLQATFGPIPNVKGVGNKARAVVEKVLEFRNEATDL